MSYANFNLFIDIQKAVINHLSSQEIFARVPIIGQDVGDDFDQVLNDRINAKISEVSAGLVAVVMPVAAEAGNPNIPGIMYDRIDFFVQWVENVLINRSKEGTRLFITQAAMATNFYLNQYRPGGLAGFYVADRATQALQSQDAGMLMMKCNHYTHGGAATSDL